MTCLICAGRLDRLVKRKYCLACHRISGEWQEAQRLAPLHPVSRDRELRPSGSAAGTRAKVGMFSTAAGPAVMR